MSTYNHRQTNYISTMLRHLRYWLIQVEMYYNNCCLEETTKTFVILKYIARLTNVNLFHWVEAFTQTDYDL
jgi:hypothetical protein